MTIRNFSQCLLLISIVPLLTAPCMQIQAQENIDKEPLGDHESEVAFILDGRDGALITIEPAGIVFNDILEYSLEISDQFPWQVERKEQEKLGTSLEGGTIQLSESRNASTKPPRLALKCAQPFLICIQMTSCKMLFMFFSISGIEHP